MTRDRFECMVISKTHGKQSAICTVVAFSRGDAIQYAIAVMCFFCIAAFVSALFLDEAKWVTIPFVLCVGIFFAVRVFKKWCGLISIESGYATCPKCSKELIFEFNDARKNLDDICHKCACCYELVPPLVA